MEYEFITIGEASRLLKQPDVVVMRMIKDGLQAGFTPEQIMKKEQRGERVMILVSKQFLLGELSQEQEEPEQKSQFDHDDSEQEADVSQDPTGRSDVLSAKDEMIAILQRIVDTKDRHIEDLSRKIDQLIERDHETNILLKGLQDRIFLLEKGNPQAEEKSDSSNKKKNQE